MLSSPKLKQLILLAGDTAVLYAALYATLFLRYGNTRAAQSHIGPFTIVFALWIIVFYIVGLYELRDLAERSSFLKRFGIALSVNFITATFFFYFIPLSSITPKINLFFFAAVFAALEYPWRAFCHNLLRQRTPRRRVLVIGDAPIAKETLDYLEQHPQLGYEVRRWIRGELTELSKLDTT
jgi:FlaA1/EpsC-like NDP-sugar epimerase